MTNSNESSSDREYEEDVAGTNRIEKMILQKCIKKKQ
jgi:hypothetical protein